MIANLLLMYLHISKAAGKWKTPQRHATLDKLHNGMTHCATVRRSRAFPLSAVT